MQTNRQQRNMNRAGNILARMLALLTAWTSLTTLAGELYVSPEGDGSGGTSWSTAYTNVQDALDAAVSNDTVYLAGRTFMLTNQVAWTNSGVTMRGGYEADPAKASPGAQDAAQWPTVLSRATGYDTRIVYMHGAHGSRLETVTVRGGNISNGAGLRIEDSMNVWLADCTIENNQWVEGYDSGDARVGGGAAVYGGSVTLTNCVVRRNSGQNTVTSNLARGVYGGGIYGFDTDLTILDSRILFNMAWGGLNEGIWFESCGGGLYVEETKLLLKNCLVAGNHVNVYREDFDRGSGIYVQSGTASLLQVTIADNPGDGIYRYGGTVTLTNSIVWGNRTDITGDVQTDHSLIGEDPSFEYGYYLASGSPAIAAGSDTAGNLGLMGVVRNVAGDPYGSEDVVNLGYHYPAGFDLAYADLYVSEEGDDALNEGTSAESPFRTLKQALSLARDGSRIHVAAGSYSAADGEFPVEVVEKVGVQILGAGADEVVLDRIGSIGRVLSIHRSPRTVVKGITLTGGNECGGAGARVELSQGVLLEACWIEQNVWAQGNSGANATYPVAHDETGGGLAIYGGSVTLTHCLIRRNSGRNTQGTNLARGVYGGGIYGYDTDLTILNSRILFNRAWGGSHENIWYDSRGGGLYLEGHRLMMKNCLVAGNLVTVFKDNEDFGSGFYMRRGEATLLQVTIAENPGDGLYCHDGAVFMTNSIVWGNWNDVVGSIDAEHSLIGEDPSFEYGYYLASGSPAIAAGSDTAGNLGLMGVVRNVAGDPYGSEDVVNLGYHYPAGFDLAYADLYVSEEGDDALNEGTSAESPFRTLKQALSLARDGSRIHVAAGSYSAADGEFPIEVVENVGVRILGVGADEVVLDRIGSSGRVLLVSHAPRTVVKGITLTGGNVSGGAGMRIEQSQGVLVADSVITNNAWAESYTSGNDFYVPGNARTGGGVSLYFSTLVVTNSTVRDNRAEQTNNSNKFARSAKGGGICAYESFLTLVETQIIGNHLKGGNSSADAFYAAGGGICFFRNNLLLRNVLLAENRVGDKAVDVGDGLFMEAGEAVLLNTTVGGNDGQGVYIAAGTAVATNSIFWSNGVDFVGDTNVVHSIVETGGFGVVPDENGNLSADPLFVDAANGNYRLESASPAIDRGLAMDWMTGAVDLDGHKRISMGQVDMGCYELPAPAGSLFIIR